MKSHSLLTSFVAISGLALGLNACSAPDTNNFTASSTHLATEGVNTALVKQIYADFGSGNIPGFIAVLSPDVVWNEAENNALADKNPYEGVDAVMTGVFGRIAQDWSSFAVKPETYVAEGNHVVMFGRYQATSAVTGKNVNPQVVHRYTIENGKVTEFQQYVDTLALDAAVQP